MHATAWAASPLARRAASSCRSRRRSANTITCSATSSSTRSSATSCRQPGARWRCRSGSSKGMAEYLSVGASTRARRCRFATQWTRTGSRRFAISRTRDGFPTASARRSGVPGRRIQQGHRRAGARVEGQRRRHWTSRHRHRRPGIAADGRWHEAMKALAVAAADPDPAAFILSSASGTAAAGWMSGPRQSRLRPHGVPVRARSVLGGRVPGRRPDRTDRAKLVTAAANARFDSLEFVDSAGAWDNAGTQFAFAALRQGEPILTILSMPAGGVERRQYLPDLDQIFDPSFSPTGTQIAFSGLSGRITDLYVFDMETAALRRLTVDGFADLQPAWSPDGRTLTFTTDRFTSSLEALTFGDYRLAAFNLKSGRCASCRQSSAQGRRSAVARRRSTVHRRRRRRQQRVQARHGGRRRPPCDQRAERRHRHPRAQPGAISRSRREPSRLQRLPNGDYEIRTLPISSGAIYAKALSTTGDTFVGDIAPAPAAAMPSFPTARYRGGLSLSSIGQPYLSAGAGRWGRFSAPASRSPSAICWSSASSTRRYRSGQRPRFRRADGLRQSPVTLDLGDARRPAAGDLPQRADSWAIRTRSCATPRTPSDSPPGHDDGGVSLQPCAAHRASGSTTAFRSPATCARRPTRARTAV